MCNVLTLRYTCTHSVRHRRSICNGTKHKLTRSGIRAACSSDSSLTLFSNTACGPCQHRIWDETWLAKIARANEFLDRCKREGHGEDGVEEHLNALAVKLTQEYTSASWLIHRTLPTHAKPRPPRVMTSTYARRSSLLRQEVLVTDIGCGGEKGKKSWFDMKEDEYDGDYIASTDPLHPVVTEYPDRMDPTDESGKWVFQEQGDGVEEGTEDLGGGDAFEFDGEREWGWGYAEGEDTKDVEEEKKEGVSGRLSGEESVKREVIPRDVWAQDTGLGDGVRDSNNEEIPSSLTTTTEALQHEEASNTRENTKTEQQRKRIIEAFWKFVNDEGD